MPKKNILRKLGLKKKYEDLILLPLGTVSLLVFCVLVFGFGLDKKFISSHAAGYVVDNHATPVANAIVCVEDNCTITSEVGYFTLESLPVGEKEISISSPHHNDINQKIRLSRGENPINLSLTAAELTQGTITLKSIEDQLVTDNLEITINDKSYQPEFNNDFSEAEIKLHNIKTGVYKFRLSSDYYIDQEVELVLEPNILNSFPIVLEPSTRLYINVVDWLDNTPLEKVAVSTDTEADGETDIQGNLRLSEISVLTKELKLKKDGYLRQTVTIEALFPGEDADFSIRLIPDRKIVYTRASASGNQIIISNYDGSESRQLTTSGNNFSPWIDEDNERIYFRKETENSRDQIHHVNFFGEETKLISSEEDLPKRTLDIIDYKNDVRFFIDEDENKDADREEDENKTGTEAQKLMSSKLDDSSQKEILVLESQVLNNIVLSQDKSQLIYGLENLSAEDMDDDDGVFVNTQRFNRTTKILNYASRVAVPQSISDDKKYLALLIDNDIFLYNFSNKSMVRGTSDNLSKSEIRFLPQESKLSYLVDENGFKSLALLDTQDHTSVRLNPESTSVTSYRIEGRDVFSYLVDNKLYVLSLKNKDFPQLIAESVSY